MIDKINIIDKPLPLNQNFKGLKEEAISYLQEFSGKEWTNFNPSDPGITILEQVCFALTELGYCNNFPIQDILTREDGELELENQFYTPEQILTTSPVTIADYRKYLIDGIDGVEDVVIEPINSFISNVSHVYRVHLYIDPVITDKVANSKTNKQNQEAKEPSSEIDQICKETFYRLNESRNLGELFLMPKPLKKKTTQLFGSIEIDKLNNAKIILGKIRDVIEELVLPRVNQKGYDSLKEKDVDTNDIFNGPKLKKGWILESNLKDKPSIIHAEDITHLISLIDGVGAVSDISFSKSPDVYELDIMLNELLVVDLIDSILKQSLVITCNDQNVYSGITKRKQVKIAPRQLLLNDIGSAIQLQPDIPLGNYRDINSYYSIQNTFPEAFAVGLSSVESDTSPLQTSQSRQLRGYLTLFDQQLANQFSQLANIPQLFSFINSTSGAPSDRQNFYAQKDKLNPEKKEYPVPYQKFSPTYFYQSLYDIPFIKPLLKNNNAFDFSLGFVSQHDLETKSWTKYKNDPYNSYIWGLMQVMEEEQVSLDRRDEILDHLLARHGESPMLINSIIDASIYTGDTTKGQVIFKSLLLQNLALLSYNRQKSFNYFGADVLDSTLVDLPEELSPDWLQAYNIDFIFDSQKVDQLERIAKEDFNNYSGLELRMNLLFGLNAVYKNFMSEIIETDQNNTQKTTDSKTKEKIKLSCWMIQNRKGAICIEPNLLVKSLHFQIAYLTGGEEPEYHVVKEKVNYHSALGIEQLFRGDLQKSDTTLAESMIIKVCEKTFSVVKTDACDWAENLWKTIPGTNNKIAIGAKIGNDKPVALDHSIFQYSTMLFFPEFIPQFKQFDFLLRINTFLESELPVHLEAAVNTVNNNDLNELIPKFCNWKNSLRNVGKTQEEELVNEIELEKNALELITLITQIHKEVND
ncbi:MAG: hypothetical protein COB15_10900 [Flavobacteriales bacterium]|nr:MAG: hypothetical protein COB15_10900 [Flavobacteriales bacterium]